MKPILVCAAQPTLDHTIVIDNFLPGRAYRLAEVSAIPSGKALNVARALRALENPVAVIGLFSHYFGSWIQDRLEVLGIRVDGVRIDGENRLAYSVYDPVSGQLTEFIEDTDGPVSEEAWAQFYEKATLLMKDVSGMVLSGRGTLGFPEDGYRQLIQSAHSHKLMTFLDCYGPLLRRALEAHPFMVKINRQEASELLSRDLVTIDDCVDAGYQIHSGGIDNVVITSGKDGAVWVNKYGSWQASVPDLKGAAVGSGDAMLAGLVHAQLREFSVADALRFGVSTAMANLLVPGPCLFNREDIQVFSRRVEIVNG